MISTAEQGFLLPRITAMALNLMYYRHGLLPIFLFLFIFLNELFLNHRMKVKKIDDF